MAKNRDEGNAKNRDERRGQTVQNLPGKEEEKAALVFTGEEIADVVKEETMTGASLEMKDVPEEYPDSVTNALDRALMHLQYVEQELRKLNADKSKGAGPLRRIAAVARCQIDGDVKDWPPLRTVRTILTAVKAHVTEAAK